MNVAIVCGGYLAFWVPWLSSPRIMFLYHYLPPLPFLYMALAWSVAFVGLRRTGVTLLLVSAGVVFLLSYPYLTAIPMPPEWTPRGWPWPA